MSHYLQRVTATVLLGLSDNELAISVASKFKQRGYKLQGSRETQCKILIKRTTTD